MNNSDKPASPCKIEVNEQMKALGMGSDFIATGLTKREAFAMAAMQGILASKYYGDFCNEARTHNKNIDSCAAIAIKHADALLKELDKE